MITWKSIRKNTLFPLGKAKQLTKTSPKKLVLKYFLFQLERNTWKLKYHIISEHFLLFIPSSHFSQKKRQKCITRRLWVFTVKEKGTASPAVEDKNIWEQKEDVIWKSQMIAEFNNRVFDRVQEVLGLCSQAHGSTLGVSCAGPGVGLNDPCGSLPIQIILWLCDLFSTEFSTRQDKCLTLGIS